MSNIGYAKPINESKMDCYSVDHQLIGSLMKHGDIFIFREPVQNDTEIFIKWLTEQHGIQAVKDFYEIYILRRGAGSITISNMMQSLNIDRAQAKEIIQVGVQNNVIQQYFSYWRVCKEAIEEYYQHIKMLEMPKGKSAKSVQEAIKQDEKETGDILSQELEALDDKPKSKKKK